MKKIQVLLIASLIAHTTSARANSQVGKLRTSPKLAAVVRDDFLSFAIDTGVAARGWETLDLSSPRLFTLMSALQPAVLRLGGTQADCLIFEEPISRYTRLTKCQPFQKPKTQPFTFNSTMWLQLNEFVTRLGRTKLLFDVNALLRDAQGRWVSSNFEKIIAATRNVTFPIIWQLGNEPNSYEHKFGYAVSPEQLGEDFIQQRHMLGPEAALVGPDVNRPNLKDIPTGETPIGIPTVEYLSRFTATAAAAKLAAVTFHQYYLNGRTADAADFLDPRTFQMLPRQIDSVRRAVGNRTVWMTETGSAWGGGADGLSDAYIAGFLWLDKLGVAARDGIELVVRQSFYGGSYALIDRQLQPNADFWISYLYKLLVGNRVLQLDITGPSTLRAYCHCGGRALPSGTVTCFTLNLSSQPAKLHLGRQLRRGGLRYMLTPPHGDVTARGALCNGRLLKMNGDALPAILPVVVPPSASLVLPPYSITFSVFRNAASKTCRSF